MRIKFEVDDCYYATGAAITRGFVLTQENRLTEQGSTTKSVTKFESLLELASAVVKALDESYNPQGRVCIPW